MIEPKVIVLENEYIMVKCYPNEGILHHEFHQYAFGDVFREIMMAELEAFETNRCTKWLSDDRKFSAVLPEDKKWGDEVWRPRILEAGWKYWAMVLPEKITGQMNIQKMLNEYEELGVTTGVHSAPEDALSWLLEQE